MPLLPVKKKEKLSCMIFHIILYNFINCSAFIDINQTLHYKVAIKEI